ncbi:CDP-diacylglycerol--glycerol-3-phosphate 3-phosphatidyltransferase 2-like isoform X2 [Salvia miltiorrhiza]|uniref:CDP-diacylglycerol--glycerol-3-phosphate 3-phosphatidyltransferase 2-like isoform X2 n=1 Tax=Salvia miltiorrhiza TaxID=226208 RepID=UPI0025AB8042|nr:CDP-diacylglycerol--glycerol-3-phosphate 3-phosphatidyltransferase 2-like isoform X2 [Salvia miltiorrhiza]
MPGALKLTNFTILHAHKPYRLLVNLSSPSHAAAAAATVDSRNIPRLSYLSGWRCRTTPFQTPAHVSTTLKFQNLCFYASDSGNEGKYGYFDRGRSDNLGTPMGAAVNGKVETAARDESDVPPPRSHGEKPPRKSSKLLTLPTILTIGRVAAVPILVYTFYVESWWGPSATVGIFVAAATTDWLDGYLARKMKLGTPFGAFLDPVADKLMVATTLILLCTKPLEAGIFGHEPWLLTVPATAIICREITMSAVREWAASRDKKLLEAVAVNNLGKWKTATQMSALTILLAAREASLVEDGTLVTSGVVLLYISAWLSLWSLVVYIKKIWRVLLL